MNKYNKRIIDLCLTSLVNIGLRLQEYWYLLFYPFCGNPLYDKPMISLAIDSTQESQESDLIFGYSKHNYWGSDRMFTGATQMIFNSIDLLFKYPKGWALLHLCSYLFNLTHFPLNYILKNTSMNFQPLHMNTVFSTKPNTCDKNFKLFSCLPISYIKLFHSNHCLFFFLWYIISRECCFSKPVL